MDPNAKNLGFNVPNVSPAQLRDKALNFVKLNGPVLPLQVAKVLETNTIYAGALLSELIAGKLIQVTHAKVGSSTLYYAKGQEEKLGPSLYNYLNQKEKQAYDRIKEEKVIMDSSAEPWQRVAMRDLKDFCIPLTVTIEGDKIETFWKFYLVPEEEAKSIIGNILEKVKPKEEIKKIEEIQPKLEKEIKIKEIPKEEKQQTIETPQEKPKEKKIKDKFYNYVNEFFSKNNIHIIEESIVKKNKEIDFIAKIPSNIGLMIYYIKAKDKPIINEADISLAFSESQHRKLPCLLLTTGKPNKKVNLLIEKKFQNITLRQI